MAGSVAPLEHHARVGGNVSQQGLLCPLSLCLREPVLREVVTADEFISWDHYVNLFISSHKVS